MSVKVLELTDCWKSLQQRIEKDHFELFFKCERINAIVSECSLIWRTEYSCRWGVWGMKTTFLGISFESMPFWTFIVTMDATCRHFEWLNISWFAVISCYSNAGLQFLMHSVERLLWNQPKLVPCYIKFFKLHM